ncbi:MAG: hypothetical protein HC853_04975 [Anaerolineae bacterium]|nr:hypothetical protein [Anaerolineae bacterium]
MSSQTPSKNSLMGIDLMGEARQAMNLPRQWCWSRGTGWDWNIGGSIDFLSFDYLEILNSV